MSLISDALKKAQRQRAEGGETPEPLAPETGAGAVVTPRIARREKPAGFRSQIIMAAVGGFAVLVVLAAAGGFWWWRLNQKNQTPPKQEIATAPAAKPTAPPPAGVPPATPSAQEVAATKAAPAPTVATPQPAPATTVAANTGAPQFTLPLGPAPTPAPAAATPTQVAPEPATTAPTTVAEVAKPAVRPKPSLHMITIIENLRVQGIRSAGEDSKVLMNDRVYRLNDVVDHDIGFRLTAVTDKSLTFEDDHGATYTRNF